MDASWTGERSKTRHFTTVGSRYTTKGDSLDVDVGADDVLDLLGKGILEGEGAGSDPEPLSGLGAKSVHDREDLALQLHHL